MKLFQWCADEEGHITFVFWGVIGFTKYKTSTLIRWFPKLPPALKYQGDAYPTIDNNFCSNLEQFWNKELR